MQHDADAFRRLAVRAVTGAGVRLRIVEGKHVTFAVAAAYMLEYERLSVGLFADSARRTLDHRLSTYAVVAVTSQARSSSPTPIYAQPRFDDFHDVRMLGDSSLSLIVTKHLSVRFSVTVTVDYAPARRRPARRHRREVARSSAPSDGADDGRRKVPARARSMLIVAVRLQTKLTVAFAAVALLPIAALTAVARVVVAERYRGEFNETLDRAADQVSRRVPPPGRRRRGRHRPRRPTPTIACSSPVLVQLAKARQLDDDVAQATQERARGAMHALGFDILEIVDERGEVLAAGHFAGHVGDRDPEALAVARRVPGKARLVRDQVFDGGRARDVLALESAREVQRQFGDRSARVVVVGGRLVGDSFVARLDPSARLYAADGTLLAARAEAPPRRWPRRTHRAHRPRRRGRRARRDRRVQRQADRGAGRHRLGLGRARRRRLRAGAARRRRRRPPHHRPACASSPTARVAVAARQPRRLGAGAHARRGRRAGRHLQLA